MGGADLADEINSSTSGKPTWGLAWGPSAGCRWPVTMSVSATQQRWKVLSVRGIEEGGGAHYLIKHWRNTILPKRRGASLPLPDTHTHTHLSICVRPGWQGTYKRWLRAICNAAVPGERPLIRPLMLRLCVERRKNTCQLIAGHLSWAGSTLLNWPAETRSGCGKKRRKEKKTTPLALGWVCVLNNTMKKTWFVGVVFKKSGDHVM